MIESGARVDNMPTEAEFLANKGAKQGGKGQWKNQDNKAAQQDSEEDSDSDFETVDNKKRFVGAIKQSKIAKQSKDGGTAATNTFERNVAQKDEPATKE